MSKKIIYLFGSGATHAVVNSIDPSKQLLTADIRDKIREKEIKLKDIEISAEIWNELMDSTVDIEHLISIMETNYHFNSTQKIREYYHDAIVDLSKDIISKVNEPSYTPNLYSILFDLHNIRELKEKIISVFTLNYEDLLEQTLKYQLKTESDYLVGKKSIKKKQKSLPILKLHGSFNWKNTRPVSFGDIDKIKGADTLWIPPGVDKKKENYPFNILWGKAFEFLLECDVLRVIGCSLSRNDWGLIPMLYTAMRLIENRPKFEIEIIDFYDKGKKVKDDYPYLNIKTIIEIDEFKEYLIDYYSIDKKAKVIPKYVFEYISTDASTKLNIFEMWLKSKRFVLKNTGKNIETKRKYFADFS